MSFHCWYLQTHDKALCQAGLYPRFLDTLVNPYKRTSRPEEETEKEHADWYKGPGNLLVIEVDSACFIVMFCNLHWSHMIFMYQISHRHKDKTVLWCWQGLLFLIHRTKKLLSNETRHHQHRSKTLLLGKPTISFPPNPLQCTPCPLPACPPTTNTPSQSDRPLGPTGSGPANNSITDFYTFLTKNLVFFKSLFSQLSPNNLNYEN